MRKVLTIAQTDLRIFFSQRGNLIGIFILPVVFALVLGYSFSDESGPSHIRIDLLDEDQSVLSTTFADALHAANAALLLCPLENDADDVCQLDGASLDRSLGIERARRERTAGFLVIPVGYGASLTAAQPAQLAYYSTTDPMLPDAAVQAIEGVLQQVNSAAVAAAVGENFLASLQSLVAFEWNTVGLGRQQLEAELYAAAVTNLAERPAAVHYRTTAGTDDSFDGIQGGFGQSIPGMGSMYVMFTVLGGTAVLLRERRQWTLQRLSVLPLTRAQILGGKILTYFTLGMIQYLVIFAVGAAVGLDFGGDWLGLLLIMIAFVLCTTALAFVLAIYMQNEEQAAGTARLLSLTLAPLGGAWWPLAIVPDFMQTVAKLSPVAWAMQGFHELIFYQGTVVSVLPEVGVLLAAAALLFGIALSQFQVR